MLYNKRRIAPILGSLILALLLLITHTVYGADQVELTSFPQDLQLYPRDLATNRATITIEGTVTGSTSIVVEISHEGTLVQTLEDTDGGEFGFIVQVPTNLIGFDFVAYAVDGEERAEIARAENVVAGDVYAINGQSNATAQSYEGLANPTETNDFVRTFGSGEQTAAAVQADDAWYVADGDSAMRQAPLGNGRCVWAICLCKIMVCQLQSSMVAMRDNQLSILRGTK